jgi:hypothetical protein
MCASRNLARLFVACLLCLTPSLAWAQQQDVVPTGDGGDDVGFAEFGSVGTMWGAVADPSDANGIFAGGDGDRKSFTFPAFSFTSTGVTNVIIKARVESSASTITARCYLVIGGTRYYGSNITIDTAYEERDCATFANNPATSSAWTESAVETTIQEAGVETVTLGGNLIGVSYFYMQANYTVGGGGSTQKRRMMGLLP